MKQRNTIRNLNARWQFLKGEDVCSDSFLLFCVKKQFQAINKYLRIAQHVSKGIFVSTDIETFGHCNRDCSFCFVSSALPDRPNGVMDETTWRKIIDQLTELRFAGRIGPYLYGEPLLDKRLPKLMQYAKEQCPLATIRINTNGDQLDEELFQKLIVAGVDHFVVTDYEEKPQERLKQIAKKYPWGILLRHQDDLKKTNRAGGLFQIESRNRMEADPCYRPLTQLVINWEGKVLLCCQDYYSDQCFGSIHENSIMDIWTSPSFQEFRTTLKKPNGRKQYKLCAGCDAPSKYTW